MTVLPRTWCALLLTLVASCASPSRPGARTPSESTRAGEVYLFRGFLNVWSYGMDQIAERLSRDGIFASVHANNEWETVAAAVVEERSRGISRGPLILIGHSYGADDALRLARRLKARRIPVDLLVTVECVTPPAVPANVRRALNIYKPRSFDFLPWWRGVPVLRDSSSATALEQIDIPRDRPDLDGPRLGHAQIDKDAKIQELILTRVRSALAGDAPVR